MLIRFASVLIVLIICSSLYSDERIHWGIEPGLGVGNFCNDATFFPKYNFNLRINQLFLQISVVDMQSPSNSKNTAGSGKQFLEAGMLGGLVIPCNTYLKCSVQGGLSFIYCTKNGSTSQAVIVNGIPGIEYNTLTYRTIGIPLGVELMFLPTKIIGMSVSLVGSINKPNSFIGLVGSIHFGKLR